MIQESAKWPDYYGDLEVQVYAPNYYYPLPERDEYSKKIVYGKSRDLSDYFLETVHLVFPKLPFKPDIIVTIPSSEVGKFSPTMLALCKKLSKRLSIKNKNIIKRVKKGRKLTDCKNYDERHSAIDGVFKVKKQLNGEKIVIMDDTRSTGVTILECAKMLRQAGASEIVALCLGITGEKT